MGSDVLVLIPARIGSKGVARKNFKLLLGRSPVSRAVMCAFQAQINAHIVVSTDAALDLLDEPFATIMVRPAELATDSAAMIDVVKHALREIPGPPEQIILLVQPTQPLRQPKHLKAAIAMMESSGADSVVSVVQIPEVYAPAAQCRIGMGPNNDQLWPYEWRRWDHPELPTRRQDTEDAYIRDGTVYAFRRATVERYGTIYGQDVRPLIIPPEETCPLDTPEDWLEAERRLRALAGPTP